MFLLVFFAWLPRKFHKKAEDRRREIGMRRGKDERQKSEREKERRQKGGERQRQERKVKKMTEEKKNREKKKYFNFILKIVKLFNRAI